MSAAIRAAVLAALQADATLMALLTGGLHNVPIQRTPKLSPTDAFHATTRELLPCGYVGVSSDVEDGPATGMRAGRAIIQVFLYQRVGHATIDAAAARVYALLHNQTVSPSSGGSWPLRWANDIPDRYDDTLDCRRTVTRYTAQYTHPAA